MIGRMAIKVVKEKRESGKEKKRARRCYISIG